MYPLSSVILTRSFTYSLAHSRPHRHKYTRAHFVASLFIRRKLISATVTLAKNITQQPFDTRISPLLILKYNEQCLSGFLFC